MAFVAIAVVLSLAPVAMAQQNVTVAWDRNTDSYTAGYRVYYGPSPGSYVGNVDVGNAITYRATVPAGTTYYIVVRAYNASGQLGPASNEIAAAVSGGPVNCVVSAWAMQSATSWGACTNGQRSRTETWARSVVTPPANGGAACPALTETRTATQSCSTTQPQPTAQLTATLPRNSNTATVTWQTTNATSVRINNVAVAASGTTPNNVTQNSTTYTLVATGPGGSITRTATVNRAIDCVVSAWSFQSAGSWGACTGGQQTRSETWARTVVTQRVGNGAACPALTQTRTATQGCSTTQPRPTAQLTATLPRNSNTATVSWQTANATSVRINNIAVGASGSAQNNVTQNATTYTLVATGPGGSITRTATVNRTIDCVVSAWSLQSAAPWGACTGGQQTRSETWARTVVTQRVGNGTACPALTQTRTGTQGCSSPSPVLPGAPQRPGAQVSGTRVTLAWAPPATGGAPKGYGIDLGTAPGKSDLKANLNVGGVLSVAAHLPRGRYYARVKAYNALGVGPASADVPFTVGVTKRPRGPVGLSGSWQHSRAVLSWTPSAEDGTGEDAPATYVILAGTASGLSNLATVRVGNVTSFQAAVPPGVYYVRVVAVNDMGASEPSNEVVLRPIATTGRPVNLAAGGEGRQVQLVWQQPSTGDLPAGYIIEAGSAPGLANLAVLRVGRQNHFTTTAPPGVYYVRVRAIDGSGVAGDASNEIVVRK